MAEGSDPEIVGGFAGTARERHVAISVREPGVSCAPLKLQRRIRDDLNWLVCRSSEDLVCHWQWYSLGNVLLLCQQDEGILLKARTMTAFRAMGSCYI